MSALHSARKAALVDANVKIAELKAKSDEERALGAAQLLKLEADRDAQGVLIAQLQAEIALSKAKKN